MDPSDQDNTDLSLSKYIHDNGDPRTQDWMFVTTPLTLIILILVYLLLVCSVGPRFMENRKPFQLKTIITIYNVYQIVACGIMFSLFFHYGWMNEQSWGCHPIDYSFKPIPYLQAKCVWWTLIIKLTEFLETIFFVLRKKQNQVTKLHLYHHTSTALYVWISLKYAAGGMSVFPLMVNSLIHVIMYTYYLISTLCSKELQQKLLKMKKYLTIIQMVQFIIIICHATTGLSASCNFSNWIIVMYIPDVMLVFYMFYNFYQKSYDKVR